MKKGISSLKKVLEIQCSNGNWNYDPYMLGLANGLILAYHIMTEKRKNGPNQNNPPYLSRPHCWLKNIRVNAKVCSLQSKPSLKLSDEVLKLKVEN